MSDVEVISIDDDDGEEAGGRSDARMDSEGETSRRDGQDDEDVQIGDSRNYHHHHRPRQQEHQQGQEFEQDHDNSAHNNNDDDGDGFEPEEEIFSQDPQGLEESKIIESCCRQQQASMAPLPTPKEGDGEDQFDSFGYAGAETTGDEDELITTPREGRGQTQRCRELSATQQPTSGGPWRPSPPSPDVNNCVDLTSPEPRQRNQPLRDQRAAAALSGFRSEYGELLERTQAEMLGFPFEAVAELLMRHPKHWWCR